MRLIVTTDAYYDYDVEGILGENTHFVSNVSSHRDYMYAVDRYGDTLYDKDDEPLSFHDPDAMLDFFNKHGYEYMTIYIYDHGGQTIRTAPFASPWDSGVFGIIYMTPEDMRALYGKKRLSKKTRQRARDMMESIANDYWRLVMEGSVYVVYTEDDEGNIMDTVGGIIADPIEPILKYYAPPEAHQAIDDEDYYEDYINGEYSRIYTFESTEEKEERLALTEAPIGEYYELV